MMLATRQADGFHSVFPFVVASAVFVACGGRATTGLTGYEDAGATEGGEADTGSGDGPADAVYDHANDINGCNPSTCEGCCDVSGKCRTGLDVSACGIGGYQCVDCAPLGAACNASIHQCGPVTADCNPNNCPTGCCNANGTCAPGTEIWACGTGGQICQDCNSPQHTCAQSSSGAGGVCISTNPCSSIITVNTPDDEVNTDGDCALREAILAANSNAPVDGCVAGCGEDEIVFAPAVVPATFTMGIYGTNEDVGLTGDFDITDGLTISGAGAALTIIDAGSIDRVFHVLGDIEVTLTDMTIRNGTSSQGGGIFCDFGTLRIARSFVEDNIGLQSSGGIHNEQGTVFIDQCTLQRNHGGYNAGGIWSPEGTMIVTNSTIRNNVAHEAGGGGLDTGPYTEIINTTLTGNRSMTEGGGVYAGVVVKVTNSTFKGNVSMQSLGGGIHGGWDSAPDIRNTILADNVGGDCVNTVNSLGGNLFGDVTGCGVNLLPSDLTGDPRLGAFVDAATPGRGHFPLLASSPAIDTADASVCSLADQLGALRADGDGDGVIICDRGAVEFLP